MEEYDEDNVFCYKRYNLCIPHISYKMKRYIAWVYAEEYIYCGYSYYILRLFSCMPFRFSQNMEEETFCKKFILLFSPLTFLLFLPILLVALIFDFFAICMNCFPTWKDIENYNKEKEISTV